MLLKIYKKELLSGTAVKYNKCIYIDYIYYRNYVKIIFVKKYLKTRKFRNFERTKIQKF